MIKLIPIGGNGVAIEVWDFKGKGYEPSYTIEFLENCGKLTVISRGMDRNIIDTEAVTYGTDGTPKSRISSYMLRLGLKE